MFIDSTIKDWMLFYDSLDMKNAKFIDIVKHLQEIHRSAHPDSEYMQFYPTQIM